MNMQINEDESDFTDTRIAGDFYGPARLVIDDETNDEGYLLRGIVEPQGGRLVLTSITFSQAPDGPPVQRGAVGKIPLEAFVYFAAAEQRVFLVVDEDDGRFDEAFQRMLDDDRFDWVLKRQQGDGPVQSVVFPSAVNALADQTRGKRPKTDEDYQTLATLYRWFRITEGHPTAILAEKLDVSRATLQRWTAKAVERGFLTEDERVR